MTPLSERTIIEQILAKKITSRLDEHPYMVPKEHRSSLAAYFATRIHALEEATFEIDWHHSRFIIRFPNTKSCETAQKILQELAETHPLPKAYDFNAKIVDNIFKNATMRHFQIDFPFNPISSSEDVQASLSCEQGT